MRVAEDEGAEFRDGDESVAESVSSAGARRVGWEQNRSPTQVENFPIWIPPVHDSTQVKHFSSIVHFCPETILESLLLRFESCWCFDEVEMGEDRDEFG